MFHTVINKADSLNQLFDIFDKELYSLGFDRGCFILFLPRNDTYEQHAFCPHCSFPDKLVQVYLQDKIYKYGPVFESIRATGKVTRWSDFTTGLINHRANKRFTNFINLLHQSGYEDGYSVPIFGAANTFGLLAISNDGQKLDLSECAQEELKHIGLDILTKYLQLTEQETECSVSLSPREKEVLSWVLRGKSNPVIADIMHISTHTVDTHIRRSCKKLDVSSKWIAAMSAVLRGILQY